MTLDVEIGENPQTNKQAPLLPKNVYMVSSKIFIQMQQVKQTSYILYTIEKSWFL